MSAQTTPRLAGRLSAIARKVSPTLLVATAVLLIVVFAAPDVFQKLWPPIVGGTVLRFAQVTAESL